MTIRVRTRDHSVIDGVCHDIRRNNKWLIDRLMVCGANKNDERGVADSLSRNDDEDRDDIYR